MTDEKKIFITGGAGMVGSRIVELLSDQFTFTNISTRTGVDITNPETLALVAKDHDHQAVLHVAAKADVDGCESDKPLGENGDAYKVNVLGTKNVVDACKVTNKKVIYISTDMVFDGDNTPEGGYIEEDKPNPKNWYAETKFQGEEVVRNSGLPFLILRIAYPYRKEFAAKKDFVRAMKDRLAQNLPISAVTDHSFNPTYIDDIAAAMKQLLAADAKGIFHVTGSQTLTPYETAMKIAEVFSLDAALISKTTRAEYFAGKAYRAFNLAMNNDKIEKLGVQMKTFDEGLQAIKN